MLYNSNKSAYELLGVYHVHRAPMSLSWDKNRKYAALAYRIKGDSHFFCGDVDFFMGDGDIIYIPAGVDYCHENRAEELLVVHLLCHNESQKTISHFHGSQEVQRLFFRLYEAWNKENYHRSMAVLHQIFELLEREQATATSLPEVIAPGVAMLQKEFRDPALTVAKLAESCFISQVYFRRLYLKHFGISPLDAILTLRFEYAKDLLRSGYYTPKQVADLSGFSEVKYFRTAFKKRFGCTPTEFIRYNRL